jgi:AcrR family transcriptional regulator
MASTIDENGDSRPRNGGGDEPASYHAILKAAITQFAQKGFEGTRIETVAREAKFNKALVYRHFTDKDGLFKAALRYKLDERIRMLPASPLDLSSVMFNYFTETLKDREYIRLIMGEAMMGEAGVIEDSWRHHYYQKHVELVKEAQVNGQLPDSIAPDFLMLMFTSMILFPAVLPQVSRMLTGNSPESEEFQERWKIAIQGLERALRQSIGNNQS